MSRLNIAPTKSNQLNLKQDLAMATEGFQLLDQKREILVMELMRLLEEVRLAQKALTEAQAKAYDTYRKAASRNGYHQMQRVAAGIHYEHSVKTRTRVAAGVRVPEVDVTHGEFQNKFGFSGTDSLIDRTMKEYLDLLEAVGRMAELETAVWLLARELKKTQRRVNALEQIFIPDFKDTLQFIDESLESKELQSIFIMKMVKKRAEARAEAQTAKR